MEARASDSKVFPARGVQHLFQIPAATAKHPEDIGRKIGDRTSMSLRWGSRMKEDVLVIIIDALDRSKFMLPKYRFQRKSSTLDGLRRPRVVVTGGIAHGYCRHAFITGESVVKGGSAFVEMLAIIIEQVYKIRRGTLPSHLVAFADNTVAQAKNEEVCLFLSALVALCHFRTSNLLFLTEGHTHEDIGMD